MAVLLCVFPIWTCNIFFFRMGNHGKKRSLQWFSNFSVQSPGLGLLWLRAAKVSAYCYRKNSHMTLFRIFEAKDLDELFS